MLINQTSKRSILGLMKYMRLQYKKLFIITIVILSALILENMGYTLFTYAKFKTQVSEFPYFGISVGGYFGAAIIAILLSCMTFFSASKTKITQKLRLPVSREIFALCNFLNILVNAAILLWMVVVSMLIETLLGKLFSLNFDNVIFVNNVTFGDFKTGLWLSISYVILAASFAYCLGIFIFRYPIQTVIVIGIIISLISLFPAFVMSIIGEASIVLVSIKTWLLILFLNLSAYLPLRKMEVVQS